MENINKVKVKRISVAENEDVYDISVMDNHNFFANGILVHNCAEEPLPDGGACLLGSMNLYEYVTPDGEFDYGEFCKDVKTATRYLNVIQQEGAGMHPLEKQRECAMKYRQIGLGYFDLAGALVKMGVKYGSEEAKEEAYKITHSMLIAAFEQSCDLNTDGVVYEGLFDSEFYKKEILPFIGPEYRGRYPLNSQLLTIAPTGTISTMLNACSNGSEPMFALSYTRDTKSIGEKTYTVYPKAVVDYFGGDISVIDESVLPECFVTADKIGYMDRVEMQTSIQRSIDASISSTANLPKEATVEDVRDIYMHAWECGAKGITVFRDGCKRDGILKRKGDQKGDAIIFNTINAPKRPKTLEADYYQVRADGKAFVIIVGILNDKPYELFVMPLDPGEKKIPNHRGKVTKVRKCEYRFESDLVNLENVAIYLDHSEDIFAEIDKISDIVNEGRRLTKEDTVAIRDAVYHIKDWSSAREYRNVALHVSGNLRTGMRIKDIAHIENKCNSNITSFNMAISRVLQKYVKDADTDERCPECGASLVNDGGCCHCPSCGWSKCG